MPCTKKATLVWDSTNEAGQALTAAVMGGEIKEHFPARIVKATNDLWKDYTTSSFHCALTRNFVAKKKAEQKAQVDSRAAKAREKTCGTTAKNGKCCFAVLYMKSITPQCLVLKLLHSCSKLHAMSFQT